MPTHIIAHEWRSLEPPFDEIKQRRLRFDMLNQRLVLGLKRLRVVALLIVESRGALQTKLVFEQPELHALKKEQTRGQVLLHE